MAATDQTTASPQSWAGQKVVGQDGSKLGKLEHVYLARGTDQPTWGVVKTGLLGRRRSFVPLGQASAAGGTVNVPTDKRRVAASPAVPADRDLRPETEAHLQRHYAAGAPSAAAAGAAGAGAGAEHREESRPSAVAMPRSRGAVTGILLVLLGAWGALIPFIGPYFDFGFTPNQTWEFTLDRLWLNILPGVAVLIGGLMLGPSANRASGGLGAWLAIVGGVWFAIGPSMSTLWGNEGLAQPIGKPIHSGEDLEVLEQLAVFFGLGALITGLAALALGRIAVRSVKDPGVRAGGA
ncbi:MAG: PRC-barrel domain-containing protein [Thermoleophilaceae bacterium]|jgi:hypothetical protein